VEIYLGIIVKQLMVLAVALDNLDGWILCHDGRGIDQSEYEMRLST